jgi:hypothetical protein
MQPTERPVPPELRAKLERELHPGERIRWSGTPVPRWFTPAALAPFLFAIPWTAFAIFWTCGAAGFKVPDFKDGADLFPLFGLPFILVGLGMLSAPLWVRRKAKGTVYAITDRRAIAIEGGWSTTIRSFLPDKLGAVFRRERRDGSGDVLISRRAWRDSDGDAQSDDLGFFSVANPKEIEAMLLELHRSAPPGPR